MVVTTNKTNVCLGGAVNLMANGTDVSSYNWTGGPSTPGYTVTPQGTTVYTVVGTNTTNCATTKTIAISVLSPTVIAVANPTGVCPGNASNLSASGAGTYTWSGFPCFGANVAVTPTSTSNYTITATTVSPGITCTVSDVLTVTVYNEPTVAIAATATTACKQDKAIVLTGSGAATYVWNGSVNSPTLSVHPQSTTTYMVDGTDVNGCQGSATLMIIVSSCTGLSENSLAGGFMVYPNPNNGQFMIQAEAPVDLILVNELGQTVRIFSLESQHNFKYAFKDLQPGIYFIANQKDPGTTIQKVVVN
jgi:hypothetical protein